jgi:hypothetical protein
MVGPLAARLSVVAHASRAAHGKLARASHERTRRRNGGAGRPFEIAPGPRGVTVSPARFERWALWGFLFGVVDGIVSNADAWPQEDWGAITAGLLAMGAGAAVIGVFLASLWNWAGTTR